MRDHIIKHVTEVELMKDRYLTLVTFEVSSPLTSGNSIINVTVPHSKIFPPINILVSSVKYITQDRKKIEYPKEFTTGND